MIITKDSHLDHGLSAAHIALILQRFGDVNTFTLTTIDIPDDLPPVPCALFGPIMGDDPIPEAEVTYEKRGNRAGESRMWKHSLDRKVHKLSVIIGEHEGQIILFTAFGGPVAPREPWDPSLSDKERAESEAFWKVHALAK